MKEIAEILTEIDAFKVQDELFTWSSGIRSPFYCDNRLLLSYPEKRDFVVKAFIRLIEEKFSELDCVAGVATAGIAHAAYISQQMKLPMLYVRSQSKGHGKQNKIEGVLEKKMKVVVVEDLISTGGSSLDAVSELQKEGAQVLGVISIFDYGLKVARENFLQMKIPFSSLTNLEQLLKCQRLTAKKRELVEKFQREYR